MVASAETTPAAGADGQDRDDEVKTLDFDRSDESKARQRSSSAGDSRKFSNSVSTLSDDNEPMSYNKTSFIAPSQNSCRIRGSENFDSLTINKLQFGSMGLYGRESEISELKHCLGRISPMSTRKNSDGITYDENENSGKEVSPSFYRELVIIKGYSGTGKSALASTLRKPVKKLGGMYVSGKFDLFLRDEPLTAVLSVCNHICGTILALQQTNPKDFEAIRNQLSSQLRAELGVILRFLPALEEIIPSNILSLVAKEETETTKGQSGEEGKNQFNFAFRRFIRVVGSLRKPLVMVLDDLQWADTASLEVLELLITDRENPNLMIVGIYRSNEVDSTHLLAKTLRDLHGKKEKDKFNMTEIEVGNLDIDSINQMIKGALNCCENRTLELADVCLRKTSGNVFFLIRFLRALEERMLLQFNIGLLKWTWDVTEIEQQTKATDNVTDLLTQQMMSFPSETTHVLQLCAFLGSTFSEQIARLVWEYVFPSEAEGDSYALLQSGLKTAKEEGFIEETADDSSSSTYTWVHDKLQEAAISLISVEDRSSFGGVGTALVSQLNPTELEDAIFTVVNLLNEASRAETDEDCIKLANFNLRAAKKASQLSSFACSSKYARKGIEMLPAMSWENRYQLALELYTVAAEAEISQGAAAEAERMSHHVIDRADVPIKDKFRAYIVLMDSVANRDRMLEGLEIGLELLSSCGCHFPKSSAGIMLQTLRGVMKVKSNAERYCSIKNFESLPIIDDPFRVGMMGILHKVLPYSYMSRQEYLPLAVMRNLFWTIKYGMCEYSASPFAWMGTILSSLGDTKTAKSYAEMANRIIETHESGVTKSLVLCVTHCFTLHMLKPLQQMLKPLLKSYEVGMQTGDTESAGWGIYHHTFIAFQSGNQLDSLAHDTGIYSRQMSELGRIKQFTYFNVTRQLCLNLMGKSDDPLILTGDAMEEDDYAARAAGDSIHLLPFLQSHRIILYGYFGAYKRGAKLALEVGDLSKEIPASAISILCACMNGLSLSHMARETGSGKYKRGAKKYRKKIKTWQAAGNPNVQHWVYLLEAEWAALQGKPHIAKRNYETAIIVASRTGFLHDAGLASERYGLFLVNDLDEHEDSMYRLQKAIQYFNEWGARGKVAQIEKKFPNSVTKPEAIFTRAL